MEIGGAKLKRRMMSTV